MRRYTEEEKRSAIERIAQIGVAKTSEEMNIAIQTLYKWRNTDKQPAGDTPVDGIGRADLKQLIQADDLLEKKVKMLEQENALLRQNIAKLKKLLIDLV